jgi:hypothetical protein
MKQLAGRMRQVPVQVAHPHREFGFVLSAVEDRNFVAERVEAPYSVGTSERRAP